jgi:hypothetical protein
MATKKQDNTLTFVLIIAIVIVLVLWWTLTRKKVTTLTTTVQKATVTPSSSSSFVSYPVTVPTLTTVISSLTDLTGTAPNGAMWGINSNTGQTFYVDSLGQWQETALPVSGHSPLTGTFAAVHLDNSQAFTSDVIITGVLLVNHYNLTVTTDLQATQGIDTILSVVADNTVRVTIKNNTGNTLSLPNLTISALQLN